MNQMKVLQEILIKRNMDAVLILDHDYHMSEYISSCFKTRAFFSGFTGSNGTLLVTQRHAFLWTDGRYTIQASKEVVAGVTVYLEDSHDPSLLTILSENQIHTLALDLRMTPINLFFSLQKQNITFISDDFLYEIWDERPSFPASIPFLLEEKYAGVSTKEKIKTLRDYLDTNKQDVLILSSLEDIAWTMNLRGRDIPHTPVFLSYFILSRNAATLYLDAYDTEEMISYTKNCGVTVKPYLSFYTDLLLIHNQTILLDPKRSNAQTYQSLANNNAIILEQNPTILQKAIKNQIEITNTKQAQIYDGVALVKFILWIKEHYQNQTEQSAQDYLTALRQTHPLFVEESFATICAFGKHAAMMHYNASLDNVKLTADEALLVDSGGHYLLGSTDITRTIALGEMPQAFKYEYTMVLKALIRLTKAIFIEGCTGQSLDVLARQFFWNRGLDYKCGTGHGIGYLLNVHEAPNGFRYNKIAGRDDSAILVPGMITTVEPGVYKQDEFGIRLENELLTIPYQTTSDGVFFAFETLTFVPFDYDCILLEELEKQEIEWLSWYHKTTYQKLSPYLSNEEQALLKKLCHI